MSDNIPFSKIVFKEDKLRKGVIEINIEIEMKYSVDRLFSGLMNSVADKDVEELKNHMLTCFRKQNSENKVVLENYFEKYKFWGSLKDSINDHGLLYNRAHVLIEHAEDFSWLYGKLKDYRSKITLYMILNNWYCFEKLDPIKEKLYSDYFDLDVMECEKDEVFVDLGAYTGDTVLGYIYNYGENKYKRIYCYEITPSIFELLKNNLAKYDNIVFRQKGASNEKGVLYINENPDTSANSLNDTGNIEVSTIKLDDDIEEKITFIKMDIEGSEQKAILGSTRHIREEKPKLALSVYHNNEDIWKIARMVEEICPGYDFYLRYHGGKLAPSEITLLAVYPK